MCKQLKSRHYQDANLSDPISVSAKHIQFLVSDLSQHREILSKAVKYDFPFSRKYGGLLQDI